MIQCRHLIDLTRGKGIEVMACDGVTSFLPPSIVFVVAATKLFQKDIRINWKFNNNQKRSSRGCWFSNGLKIGAPHDHNFI